MDKIYSISKKDGTLTLTRQKEDWLGRRNQYSYCPDVFINPTFDISNGVLTVTGKRHSYESIYRWVNSWDWGPYPTKWLKEGWEDNLFYSEEDIVKCKLVEWTGSLFKFNLKRRVDKNAEHLIEGRYLQKTYIEEEIRTSNFRIEDE